MPNRGLWVGILLLALTLGAGGYVVQSSQRAPKRSVSTGTQLTADVMDAARKSCCAEQDSSTKPTASVMTQLTGAPSQPEAGQATVESSHANKESWDHVVSRASEKAPVKRSTALPAKLARQEGTQQEAVCPISGASLATKKTSVADVKVASATR